MNKQTIQELEELLEFSSAASLRQSLQEVFFAYLMHNNKGFPEHYEKTVDDFYFLINFFEKADGHNKKWNADDARPNE